MTTSRRKWLLSLIVVALIVAATRSIVVVDETQFVLVTTYGRIATVYGDETNEAGLHAKWPWQSSLTVDRRLRVFDPPSREVMTSDKRNLEIGSYVVWRVDDPARFVRSAGSPEAAEARLNERVSAALSDGVGGRTLASLASTDDAVWALDRLTEEVVASVATPARRDLGVAVVDVRLRRFNHPVEVRPAVFDLIRSERRQVAAALRAEGEAEYQTLTSRADRERDALLAQADAEAERIQGQAEAEAARLANEAHARDPRFFEFLRTLDAYRAILDGRSTVVLSSNSPLLRLLAQGPADDLTAEPSATPARESHP